MPCTTRRCSGGSTKGASAASLGSSPPQWLTTKATAWRTAPSAMGFRIDTLPCGWQVSEAARPVEPTEGWLPIQPRGYLQLSELTPCVVSGGAMAKDDEPFVMSAVSTPPSKGHVGADESPQDVLPASSRAALLALREEHVRLKEVNLLLREKEMKERQELDELGRARETAVKELADVKEELAKGHEDLAHCQDRCAQLRHKMEHCREAVATAISSVDQLYAQCAELEESTDTPALSGDEQGPVLKRRPWRARKDLKDQAVEEARAAGAVVSELLTSLGCQDQAQSVGEDKYRSAQENSNVITVTKKVSEDASLKAPARSPSVSPLQLDERCRAPFRDLNVGR